MMLCSVSDKFNSFKSIVVLSGLNIQSLFAVSKSNNSLLAITSLRVIISFIFPFINFLLISEDVHILSFLALL